MVHAGVWLRPEYYRADGKSRDDCIYDEAMHVRQQVGLIDVGTLGKLQVNGPDAVRFLEHIYTGRFAKQQPGRLRYGLACDELGIIIEDGVIARDAEQSMARLEDPQRTILELFERLDGAWDGVRRIQLGTYSHGPQRWKQIEHAESGERAQRDGAHDAPKAFKLSDDQQQKHTPEDELGRDSLIDPLEHGHPASLQDIGVHLAVRQSDGLFQHGQ